jgi:hypothetical protein
MRKLCDNTHTKNTSHNQALNQTISSGALLNFAAVDNFRDFPNGGFMGKPCKLEIF